ncbi:MAG: hypothetical protein ACLVBP_13445 [Ruminococcus sp.]
MAFRIYVILSLPKTYEEAANEPDFNLSVRPYFPKCRCSENSGISRNAPISEDFEAHGVLQFSLSNLPAQERANLSAILAEKQTLINKAIPGFTMKEDSILIVEENSFISSEKEAAYRQFLEKLLQTAHARKWVVPNRKIPVPEPVKNIVSGSG